MDYKPTDEQVAVLDSFAAGNNGTVKAYAGAGKTSTLVQAAALAPNRRGIFTAFNKKIITDSAQKFGRNVRCQTTHALAAHVLRADGGWRANRLAAPRIHGRKLATLLMVNDPIPLEGRILHPSRLASLALMMVDRFATSGDDEIGWWHMPHVPGIEDRDTRKIVGDALVPAARRAWADVTNPKGVLRYTHNYYRKEYALTHPRIDCDFIMVDEAQDSAGVLVRLMQDQAQHGTQIITVGDSYQAINGWAGAIDAMDKFDGDQLLLTQSFRFGHAIADEANKWLELLGAPAPLRGFNGVQSIVAPLDRPNAILCRTNGAVVAEVIDRLADGQKIAMLGDPKEIINFTRGAGDLIEKGWSGHPDLMAFGSWGQVQEYVDHDEAGADLKVMVDMIDKHGTDVIESCMGRLSTPYRADVVLSTAHKCKGAEWAGVRIGPDFKAPREDEITKRRIVSRDAAMLNYVAVTRAQKVLDRGSLSWVDEVLAEHREHGGRAPRPTVAAIETAADPEPAPAPFGPQDDPDLIARVDISHLTDPAPAKAGDHLGPLLVVDTDRGLGTVLPLDVSRLDKVDARAHAFLLDAARTPIVLPGDVTPEWAKAGMPGADWTSEDVAEVKAAASARFDESLRIFAEGTEEEKAKRFGTPIPKDVQRAVAAASASGIAVADVVLADPPAVEPETFEAPVDGFTAETAPPAPKVLTEEDLERITMEWGGDPKRPGSCGAKHRTWMNTYCLLDPHTAEHPHRVQGIAWDDSQCSELGVAPAHA